MPDLVQIHTELRGPGVTLELLHLEYLADHPDGLPLLGLLRALSALGRAAALLDAPGPHGRREDCLSTTRASGRTLVDPRDRRDRPRRALCRRARRLQLHLRRGDAARSAAPTSSRVTRAPWSTLAASPPSSCRINCGPASAIRVGMSRRPADAMRTGRGTTARSILPARPAKPRDKAKVEVGVQVAERWILARLRHETFFTLAALNERIAELLEDLNDRPMKGYGGQSRRDALRALRSAGAAAAAARPLRPRRLEPGARQHRLSRRGRPPLSTRSRTR